MSGEQTCEGEGRETEILISGGKESQRVLYISQG